jgi:hypothetical protein
MRLPRGHHKVICVCGIFFDGAPRDVGRLAGARMLKLPDFSGSSWRGAER